jgi:LemA protein
VTGMLVEMTTGHQWAYTDGMIEFGILSALIVAACIWIYNQLVKDRNQVSAAWSDIDVQLKRRHELVPRLVSCVKAYADYEKATLTAVTELRKQSIATSRLPQKAAIEDAMQAGLHQLVVLAEDYPDLKADGNFRQLQSELTDTEDQIQYARRFYNGAVRIFNTRIQSFPHLLIARPLGFIAAEFFEIEGEGARLAPTVGLSQ